MKKTMIFGVGALTGALVCRLFMKESMEKTIQKEVASVTEYYKDKLKEEALYLEVDHPFSPLINSLKESIAEIQGRVKKLGKISQKIYVEKFEQLSEEAEKTVRRSSENPYKKLTRDETPEEEPYQIINDIYDKAEKNLKNEYPKEDPPEEPYYDDSVNFEVKEGISLISDIEFSEGNDQDKITLWYYEYDDVVVDDSEEIVDDVEYLLGEGALSVFSETQNTIYIRNENTGVDYEVIRLSDGLSKKILGDGGSDKDG